MDRILEGIATPRRLATQVHTSDAPYFCHFWYAIKAFWEAYMELRLPIYDYIENRATAEDKSGLERNAKHLIVRFTVAGLISPRPDIFIVKRGSRYLQKLLTKQCETPNRPTKTFP